MTTVDRPLAAPERGAAPGTGPAQAADLTGHETVRAVKAARRTFRPARTVPAVVVAALLALASLLVAAELISRLVDRPLGLLPVDALARYASATRWDDPATFAVAAGLGVAGLVLVALAVWPGRPPVAPVAIGEPGVLAVVTHAGQRRFAVHAALSVDGISHAAAWPRRRVLWVRVTSPLYDTSGLATQVEQAVAARLERLALLRPPAVRVIVARRREE